MKPKAGCEYIATASRFAEPAEKAVVFHIDPGKQEIKVAYPIADFKPDMLTDHLSSSTCSLRDKSLVQWA